MINKKTIILEELKQGEYSLQEIGNHFGLSRERIRQIWVEKIGGSYDLHNKYKKQFKERQRQTIRFICPGCKTPVTFEQARWSTKYCKSCAKYFKKGMYIYSEEYREYERERARRYYQTQSGKSAIKKATERWSSNNPEATRAHWKARHYLIKKPCIVCNTTQNIHKHHDNYNQPLDVIYLCALHHKERHKSLNVDKNIEKGYT